MLGVSALGLGVGALEVAYYDRIYPGVSVWGVNVGGLTLNGALERLSRQLDFLQAEAVTLRAAAVKLPDCLPRPRVVSDAATQAC